MMEGLGVGYADTAPLERGEGIFAVSSISGMLKYLWYR